jgi:hypothetical protein
LQDIVQNGGKWTPRRIKRIKDSLSGNPVSANSGLAGIPQQPLTPVRQASGGNPCRYRPDVKNVKDALAAALPGPPLAIIGGNGLPAGGRTDAQAAVGG